LIRDRHSEVKQSSGSSYGEILKSSILIGGSSAFSILVGFARTKIIAVFLGPQGIALYGLLGSIADLGHCIAGLGINYSGVRRIAEAAATNDESQIALTASVLRKLSTTLATLGALVIIFASGPISRVTFGGDGHQVAVACISIAVFLRLIASSRDALIMGTRRIGSLAKMSISGSFFGSIASLPLIIWLGKDGIVPALISGTAASFLVSWWFSKKIRLPLVPVSWGVLRAEVPGMLKLGIVLMMSALLSISTIYVLRLIIIKEVGLEAGGLYQAAATLGSLYVGFVLNSMGADYLPRLMQAAKCPDMFNRLVNEQIEIVALLAPPGIIGTITFAPLVIQIFYSSEFFAAVPVILWITLGLLFRITAWALDYVVLAQGRKGIFFVRDLGFSLVQIALTWIGVGLFGIEGAGIALAVYYVISAFTSLALASHITGFRLSRSFLKTMAIMAPVVAVTFAVRQYAPPLIIYPTGVVLMLVTGAVSLRHMVRCMPETTSDTVFYKVLDKLKWLDGKFSRNEGIHRHSDS
jgi:enterobacterial common antigen flippase